MLCMGYTTGERAAELINGVLQETDDDEQRFKLRTALQLLDMIQEQHEVAGQALADSELDEGTRENLRGLGYLE
ncbi:hypothetical protein SAMN06265347_106139 [Halobellus salinus]|nr:hypothetical protein SAMN06265347_106139 [Halobellus salinus]